MPKLDLRNALRIKGQVGELTSLKGSSFSWVRPGDAFTPLALFAAGEQGVWYDPSDFSTMFQDATGTMPVNAVGQAVGLVLDKSKGGVSQTQLVTNGDFSEGGIGWSLGLGWRVEGGQAVFNTTGVADSITQGTVIAGRTYVVTYTLTTRSAGTVAPIVGGRIGTQRSTPGTYTEYLVALNSSGYGMRGNPVFVGAVNNIFVREVPGNHATQATAPSRPILRQDVAGPYSLEFDGTDDFLVTGNIDFSATDEMTVIAGVRKLSDAATGLLYETSASSSAGAGSFFMLAPSLSGSNSYRFGARGNGGTSVVGTGVFAAAPATNVVTALSDISSDLTTLRVDGALNSNDGATDQGAGNFGAYPLFIGRRGGTTTPFNGRLYSLIARGKMTAGTDLTNAEAYVAQQTGVMI